MKIKEMSNSVNRIENVKEGIREAARKGRTSFRIHKKCFGAMLPEELKGFGVEDVFESLDHVYLTWREPSITAGPFYNYTCDLTRQYQLKQRTEELEAIKTLIVNAAKEGLSNEVVWCPSLTTETVEWIRNHEDMAQFRIRYHNNHFHITWD